jgi:hypothetical protein
MDKGLTGQNARLFFAKGFILYVCHLRMKITGYLPICHQRLLLI